MSSGGRAGNISINASGLWTVLRPSDLPLTINGSSTAILFTPTTDMNRLPLLCNAMDSFRAVGRNLNSPIPDGDGPTVNVTLFIGCQSLVCPAGQQVAVSSSSSLLCVTCSPGFYNLEVNSTCKACPSGGYCSGGASLSALADKWFFASEQQFYSCNLGRCCPKVSLCERD